MPAQLQHAVSRSADCSKVIRSLPPRTLSCPPPNFHTEDQPLYIYRKRTEYPSRDFSVRFFVPLLLFNYRAFSNLMLSGWEKTGGVWRAPLSCRFLGYFATKEDARAIGNVHCTPAMCFRVIGKGHCILTMRLRSFGKGYCTFTMRFRAFGHGLCSHCKALPRSSQISFHLQ